VQRIAVLSGQNKMSYADVALVVIVLVASFLLFAFFVVRSYAVENERLKIQGVLEDLQYATTDQLLKEFRSRPKNIYVLIKPIDTPQEQGFKIELNGMSLFNSLTMMHLGLNLVRREMQNKGMEIPELPVLFKEDDDDEQTG